MIISLIRTTFFECLALIVFGVLTGCTAYQYGSGVDLPFEKIYVRPASNESFAPQSQALITTNIRKTLIRDGRVKLVSSEEFADVILYIKLKDYTRTARALRSTDTEIARSFDLKLVAEISLFNCSTGRYLVKDRIVNEMSTAHTDNPYQNTFIDQYALAEYQSMPHLTRGLSRKISDIILGAW